MSENTAFSTTQKYKYTTQMFDYQIFPQGV